jgi:phosphatidylglycerol:prolipoprotein diacylglycerol transferase
MITVPIDPILLSIGHFMIRWYGIIVTIAIFTGVWLGMREARRKGFDENELSNAVLPVILAGILGARLFHVLDHWGHEYAANPIRALYFWEGGLAIWGAVAGGLLAVALSSRKYGWRLPALLDAFAPGLVLAQAIGRIACLITGDAMGKPTLGPLGFAYSSPNAMVPELGVYYTPMPLYEIIVNLSIFAVLWQLRKRSWPDGRLFLLYLVMYSLERFALGFVSSYQILALGLTQSQWISVIGLAVAGLYLLRLKVLKPQFQT